MTRKDYILLARALHERLDFERNVKTNKTPVEAIYVTARRISDALRADNPRFDREHFLAVVRGEKALESRPPRS